MPVQRKVFRVEEMLQRETPDLMPMASAELAMWHHETLRELKVLCAVVQRQTAAPPPSANPDPKEVQLLKSELHKLYETIKHTKQEIAALHCSGFEGGQMAQVNNELGAVVGSAENATQRILTAAEAIDEHANTLAADLLSDHQMNLTQDIQERVVRIFEACVFHDLTGQRIAKVTAALKVIEEHVARMVDIWGGPEAFGEFISVAASKRASTPNLINGPRLDAETDHVTQGEIDGIFTTFRPA